MTQARRTSETRSRCRMQGPVQRLMQAGDWVAPAWTTDSVTTGTIARWTNATQSSNAAATRPGTSFVRTAATATAKNGAMFWWAASRASRSHAVTIRPAPSIAASKSRVRASTKHGTQTVMVTAYGTAWMGGTATTRIHGSPVYMPKFVTTASTTTVTKR